MNYKDYSILTENDYKVINQHYTQALHEENNELQVILNKMKEQQSLLKEHNVNGKYSSTLDKLDLSITELKNIINNNLSPSTTFYHSMPAFIKSKILQIEDNSAISPTRGYHEMRGRTQPLTPTPSTTPTLPLAPERTTPISPALPDTTFSPTLPSAPSNSNNNTLNPNSTLPQSPTMPNLINNPTSNSPLAENDRTNISKRNRPMQSNPFANFIKSFNLKNIFRKKVQSNSTDYTDTYKNRFHNLEHCQEHNYISIPNNHSSQNNQYAHSRKPSQLKGNDYRPYPFFNNQTHTYHNHNLRPSPQEAMQDYIKFKDKNHHQHYHNPSHALNLQPNANNKSLYSNSIYNNIYSEPNNEYTSTCSIKSRLHYNQIDIIRLLLLYLSLRPNCRYCSRISTLANDQFDILLELHD